MQIRFSVTLGVILFGCLTWTSAAKAACGYAVSTPGPYMSVKGGNILYSILTDSNCAWSVTGLPAWLSVSGSAQGTGPALVKVVATDNPGGPRDAVFTVAGVSVWARQFDSAACGVGFCSIRPVPHVAFGGEWTTDLFAVNVASHAGHLSVLFYGDSGAPVALPFAGGLGNLNTLTDSIPAQGRKDYEAANASLAVQGGWALVTSDEIMETQAVFRRATPDGAYYEAAVHTGETYSGFVVPFDATAFAPTGGPLYTGFAVANVNPSVAAHLACTARDDSGAVIPNALTIPTLNPMGHWANYLFPALAGKRGSLECYADTLVSAIALRVISTGAFSTLPVIILNPGLD